MKSRSAWTIVRTTPEFVVIQDIGGPTSLTVTNDAENVVDDLVAQGLGSRRLFYIDSYGDTDELVVKDGKFHKFAPGGPR